MVTQVRLLRGWRLGGYREGDSRRMIANEFGSIQNHLMPNRGDPLVWPRKVIVFWGICHLDVNQWSGYARPF